MDTSISGYTTTYNCLEMEYPFLEAIESMLGFCDEVVVVDAGSTDGTIESLRQREAKNPKLKIYVEEVDFAHPRWAIHQDGYLKAKARARCTKAFCWQTDTDEVVAVHDFEKIRALPQQMGETKVVMLPMIEFWGSFERIRGDFFSWKPRFSRNEGGITHGIPSGMACIDGNGFEYPRPYVSDSCNYLFAKDRSSVPIVVPISAPIEQLVALPPQQAESVFFESLNVFPAVYHVSWLNLERKIRHYKKLWKKFHASMYNLDVEDTAGNNVMFDKPWSAVTDVDIQTKAAQLKEIGPRSFHYKIDYSQVGTTFQFNHPIPESLRVWAESR